MMATPLPNFATIGNHLQGIQEKVARTEPSSDSGFRRNLATNER
jgi:hypothetical protein